MSLKFSLISLSGQFEKVFQERHGVVARAATGAMRIVVEGAKKGARRAIAQGGFSARFQNTLRSETFPKGSRASIEPAGVIWHKIPYAGVFEKGAIITGKPFMWIPTDNVPARIGRNKVTPKLFQRSNPGVKLVRVGKPGSPILVGKYGANSLGRKKSVPLFIGVRTITIGRKFDVQKPIRDASNRLPFVFSNELERK